MGDGDRPTLDYRGAPSLDEEEGRRTRRLEILDVVLTTLFVTFFFLVIVAAFLIFGGLD